MDRYWELQDILDNLINCRNDVENEMNEYPLNACPMHLHIEYEEINEQIAAIEEELEEIENEEENEWDEDDEEPISFSVVENKEDIV